MIRVDDWLQQRDFLGNTDQERMESKKLTQARQMSMILTMAALVIPQHLAGRGNGINIPFPENTRPGGQINKARAGQDPGKASRWAVMCANRRQFEREHAEDLRISAIFIKYTVGCFISESIQSINRDDVAICRSFAACQPFSQSFLPAILMRGNYPS